MVQEADAAFPVAVEHVAGQRAVDVVLTAHEVPHEVPPVHPVELVVKEVRHIGPESGLAVLGTLDAGAFALGVFLVEIYVAGIRVGPHTGEEHLALRVVHGIRRSRCFDVFAIQGSPVGTALDFVGSAIVLTVEQRRGAILLAAQVTDQGVRVIGLILIGGRFHAGADDHDGEQREADGQRGHAQQNRIEEHLFLLEGDKQAPEAKGQHPHQEEQGTGIVRQAEPVHEDAVEPGGRLGEVRDEEVHKQELDDHADGKNADELLERQFLVFVLAVVVHEDEGRDGEEVEQVYADAEAHQEGDEHNPAVGVRLIGLLVPLAHSPENEGREEGRHGINLALHRAEPERIGEAISQSSNSTCTKDSNGLGQRWPIGVGHDVSRHSRLDRESHHPLRKEDDGEVQEEDGEGAQDGVHGVHGHGGMLGVHRNGEEAGQELEHGVSRGVTHLQLIR